MAGNPRTIQNKIRSVFQILGPGLTTGASDDDPSGVATYAQTGAQFGYQLLWLSLFTFPLMAIVQEMCARLGIVTRKGLSSNLRSHLPRPLVFFAITFLLFANTLNIGADLSAMAAGGQLLFPVPVIECVILITLLTTALQILMPYHVYAKVLKWLCAGLVLYILTAFVVRIPWGTVLLATVIPTFTFSKESILIISAILGTSISPYLFFWQTSQEIEELDDQVTQGAKKESMAARLHAMRIDVCFGMFFSNLIMFFIIAVTASTLHLHGMTSIGTAADAAKALEPLAGKYASLFFSIGLIGTGLLALPVLAGANAYALADFFGWHEGLATKPSQSPAFYAVITISMVVGLGIAMIGFDPIRLLVITAVINGVVAAPFVALIVWLTAKKSLMGKYRSHPVITVIGIAIAILMALAGGVTVLWSLFP